MRIFTRIKQKPVLCILQLVNISKGWYQNVQFGGNVLNPRYNSGKSQKIFEEACSRKYEVELK